MSWVNNFGKNKIALELGVLGPYYVVGPALGAAVRIRVVRLATQSNLELLELGDMGPYCRDALG